MVNRVRALNEASLIFQIQQLLSQTSEQQLFSRRQINNRHLISVLFNPLMGRFKAQSNGPLYSNTVIGTLAVDGWAVAFGTAKRCLGGAGAQPSPLLAVSTVTTHPSTASVPTSYCSMWHYNCLRTLKG